jgi:hypothetical protein
MANHFHTPASARLSWFSRLLQPPRPALLLAGLLGIALSPVALVPSAQAQTLAAATAPSAAAFTLSSVRPEALSWWWDNADEATLKAANAEVQSFRWLSAPATPQHLGYSTGAVSETVATFGGGTHKVVAQYADPQSVKTRVASDNYLGAKPYSFVAQRVSIDGGWPFTVLVQYVPTGSTFSDSSVRIDLLDATPSPLATAYVAHLARSLQGLAPKLMPALNERYFNAVLKTRGSYVIGKADSKLNVPLTITQEIKGITPEMLNWWWDHIGNTERYRLWQPQDHVSFEWTKAPTQLDSHYDVGAQQKVKEYVGKIAFTLDITGADPLAIAPPVSIIDPGYFYARTNLSLLSGILPDNSLVHQWKANATGDGVLLTSHFVNIGLVRILSSSFFEDLGSHALREFQMLPYFLPRLYKREQLGL